MAPPHEMYCTGCRNTKPSADFKSKANDVQYFRTCTPCRERRPRTFRKTPYEKGTFRKKMGPRPKKPRPNPVHEAFPFPICLCCNGLVLSTPADRQKFYSGIQAGLAPTLPLCCCKWLGPSTPAEKLGINTSNPTNTAQTINTAQPTSTAQPTNTVQTGMTANQPTHHATVNPIPPVQTSLVAPGQTDQTISNYPASSQSNGRYRAIHSAPQRQNQ
ncbi:hypothetical protein QBC46DRAFT_93276 [Diplogelasinospora grovesii]|uniref:Uncharacterized protein n=1 Tax=Diplogelasinospora grovesii TaxID=303347 RepID=A0AAN6NK54_9PEZI|nr:hypothetical protein QBC46DRAFT_93276 [Diplogelasinospora grovesii]